jgi:hypothetical protein
MADEPTQSGGDESASQEGEEPALLDAAHNLRIGAARISTLPERLRHLPERARAQQLDLEKTFADQEHDLRERYANGILAILGVQLLVADAVFIAFAWAGESWSLSPGVIEVWLAATVVQVVGIVLIVTRHLFPNRDGRAATG